MPKAFSPGCKRPESTIEMPITTDETTMISQKEEKTMISVGQKAPDFELSGYQQGEFKSFRLSEYIGKWVVLCFYPGDFTFV